MTDSITNNQQKHYQIELEYDQDILESENSKFTYYLKISNGERGNGFGTREFKMSTMDKLYVKCMELSQKSKELKLAKLN